MKNILKYACIALVGSMFLTSCEDDKLDTQPTGSMSGSVIFSNARSAMIAVNGIYRSMYSSGWSTSGNTHQCFGISAYNLMAEVMGDDMIMGSMGSGWFWFDASYDVKRRYTNTAWRPYDLWNANSKWIDNANSVLKNKDNMAGDKSDIDYVVGQAYAIRAYAYFMMAQQFARTYKGHETEPCVPIYTQPTYAGKPGNPRSTVADVYNLIVSDIDSAAMLLQGKTQQHSSHIAYSVARGLQARIALVMEDWSTARDAAVEAIRASGKRILPVDQFEGNNKANAGNVMWGAEIIADQTGYYASLFAHMDTVASYGSRAPKQITKSLYEKMSETDTRRSWWNPNSSYSTGGYQQKKFSFSDAQTWLGDYVWMRVEEMYLIAAEAECRLGNETAAKNHLMALMKERDPQYTCDKTGTELGKLTSDVTGSLLEEIITQRRIELWGEIGRVYDIRRLHQGFRRTAADGWPSGLLLSNRPTDNPENYMWVLTIPQTEFDGNINLDITKDQNPAGDE